MATESNNNTLASSMTDLMASLMVIFILLFVATLNNKRQEAQQKADAARSRVLTDMRKTLNLELEQYKKKDGKDKEDSFDVKNDDTDPLGLVIIVPEGLLNFAPGSDEIPSPGISFLGQIIPKMTNAICAENSKSEISSIVVEGHADKTGSDEINLPLSQRRSMSVVIESMKILQNNSNRPCFLKLVSATGRGSSDDKDQPDDARRRRVIFKIRVSSQEEKQVIQIFGSATPSPTP